MLLGAYIITADANDFPMPFFKEVNRQAIYYDVKNRRKHIVIYLLQPDSEAIEAGFGLINPPKPEGAKKKSTAKH